MNKLTINRKNTIVTIEQDQPITHDTIVSTIGAIDKQDASIGAIKPSADKTNNEFKEMLQAELEKLKKEAKLEQLRNIV